MIDVSTLTSMQASCVRHGGFVTGAHRFDAHHFGISLAEAGAMDPHEAREVFTAVWDSVGAISSEVATSSSRSKKGRASDEPLSGAEVLREAGEEELPTRSLLKLLTKALGRKEANKIARNRAEAVGDS